MTGNATGARFSLELDDDQIRLQHRVHDFAEGVMRPVARHWDEREEMPWPVIEQAADAGLYSPDFVEQMWADPTGLVTPIVMEELAWGDAGITLAVTETSLAVSAIKGQGTPAQAKEWLPQCFRSDAGRLASAAFAVSERQSGSDVGALRTSAVYDQAAKNGC